LYIGNPQLYACYSQNKYLAEEVYRVGVMKSDGHFEARLGNNWLKTVVAQN
jgi:hypothetical protein